MTAHSRPTQTGETALLMVGDKTPPDYEVPVDSRAERFIKKPLRRALYPPYRAVVHRWLERTWAPRFGVPVDQWLWGHRGNDYEAHRRRVNAIYPLRGKRVLIAGCGTGRDIPSWLPYEPAEVVGVDYFNYDRAWVKVAEATAKRQPRSVVRFAQANLAVHVPFPDQSFEIVGSDALFEHVADLNAVLNEFHRLLVPGGLVYATFGPLWYSWHGDHISGYDAVRSGYNHLVLDPEQYRQYISGLGQFAHSEQDGRTWVGHGLFSYLRPLQYLDALEAAGFERMYLAAIVDPMATRCLRENPDLRARLLAEHEEMSLVIGALSIIYRRPAAHALCAS